LVEAIFLAALRLGARRSQSERCLAPIIVHGRLRTARLNVSKSSGRATSEEAKVEPTPSGPWR
ncbi:hypothetical protein, partial [Sinorhizobium medicae]|uniref:hypothetical protein n=1 Tax=Sinorhizobium medicae TaxID=110321 RepID=UPI001AECF09E